MIQSSHLYCLKFILDLDLYFFFIISDYGNHSIRFQFNGVVTFWDLSNFLKKLIYGDLTCKSFLVYLTHYSTLPDANHILVELCDIHAITF